MPEGIDTQQIGQITAAFMETLDQLHAQQPDQIPDGSVVGDVVIVAEIKRPDGSSTVACRWSDPVRRHVVLGLLESARDIAKMTING